MGMEEQTRELFPGVRLTMMRTDRFRSGCFSVHLLRPLRAEDVSRDALLPFVLRRGTRTLPDEARISSALDGLFGSSLEPDLLQMGETLPIGFRAAFPEDRFLSDGEDCLSRIVALSGEVLLDPVTRGGLLRDDYVRFEGQNLHDWIKTETETVRGSAIKRARELMFAGEAFGVWPLWEAEDALRVHYQALTKHYREVLRTSPVELFYCGSAEGARVEEAARRAFMTLPGGGERIMPETLAVAEKRELRHVTEKTVAEQGILVLGFRRHRSGGADYPALEVFNRLFGGGPTSRLFLNVREEKALCSDIDSRVERYKEIMTVTAFTDFSRREEAEEAILTELAQLAAGNISFDELKTARHSAVQDYLQKLSSPLAVCAFRLGQNLLGAGGDLRQYAALASEVRAEDVARIASEMQPELSCYRGRGAENGDTPDREVKEG